MPDTPDVVDVDTPEDGTSQLARRRRSARLFDEEDAVEVQPGNALRGHVVDLPGDVHEVGVAAEPVGERGGITAEDRREQRRRARRVGRSTGGRPKSSAWAR